MDINRRTWLIFFFIWSTLIFGPTYYQFFVFEPSIEPIPLPAWALKKNDPNVLELWNQYKQEPRRVDDEKLTAILIEQYPSAIIVGTYERTVTMDAIILIEKQLYQFTKRIPLPDLMIHRPFDAYIHNGYIYYSLGVSAPDSILYDFGAVVFAFPIAIFLTFLVETTKQKLTPGWKK